MKEIIRRKIREAIKEYDWRCHIEYILEEIDIQEIISDAIENSLDIKSQLKDYIEEIIESEIEDIDIEELL